MKFYVRRFSFYAITLWAAISLNFLIPRLLPGDPATIMLARLARSGDVTPSMIRSVELLLGSEQDASLWQQYLAYWGRLLQGDLGVSITNYPSPVIDLIAQALPWTLVLVGIATVIAFVIGIGLGAWIGWKRGTWADHIIPFTTLLQSIPYFWLALILVFVFSVTLGHLPIIHGYDVFTFRDGPELSWAFIRSAIYHGTLPAVTIVLSAVGGWLLGMRNMTVSTLAEDYITTAEAKGLRPRRIFFAYTVRNAALPSIAGFAVSLGFVVAGSIVMEQVFSYPGIGKLLITSVQNNDYALMQGVFLVITVAVLAANFLMDLLYGFADPRTRHNG
ncbi:ABC transporter permease [Georgenia satyanarayanai]|uniref:ABC transporter permease n=1 Tax=Georgenia satyanarayanai TaxID=860221 RepID=UPI00203D09C5|nr:ABC transporter permease [Georgenia satyanarayanai]MCM3660270.1 ABC transporter permease [Georgenia satyanarayanai]